jgi:H2-forming N5,N10-methylenetetrahydromethanopterin dehydrogenase-like enzyme
MSNETRRVALVNEAGGYVGPAMARELARRGHDLVLGNPSPELIGEL